MEVAKAGEGMHGGGDSESEEKEKENQGEKKEIEEKEKEEKEKEERRGRGKKGQRPRMKERKSLGETYDVTRPILHVEVASHFTDANHALTHTPSQTQATSTQHSAAALPSSSTLSSRVPPVQLGTSTFMPRPDPTYPLSARGVSDKGYRDRAGERGREGREAAECWVEVAWV